MHFLSILSWDIGRVSAAGDRSRTAAGWDCRCLRFAGKFLTARSAIAIRKGDPAAATSGSWLVRVFAGRPRFSALRFVEVTPNRDVEDERRIGEKLTAQHDRVAVPALDRLGRLGGQIGVRQEDRDVGSDRRTERLRFAVLEHDTGPRGEGAVHRLVVGIRERDAGDALRRDDARDLGESGCVHAVLEALVHTHADADGVVGSDIRTNGNLPDASTPTCCRAVGWAPQSKSSRVLRAGNPAALIRSSAPEALRALTSRSRTAAR